MLGSVDGLKRFVEIKASPYHGLNFCQGTVAEMLEEAGRADLRRDPLLRHRAKKIFNVHFRNIRGRFLDFRETFIDDGDVDMLKAMRVYKEVGFDGMMMPDHVPTIAGDAQRRAGVRVHLRLHQGAHRRRVGRSVTCYSPVFGLFFSMPGEFHLIT